MLPLLAAFLTTFTVQVGDLYFNDKPKESQVIPVGPKYHCYREPLLVRDNKVAVMITCEENGEQAFVLGAICRTDIPDRAQSTLYVNTGLPKSIMFLVSCETDTKQGTYLGIE